MNNARRKNWLEQQRAVVVTGRVRYFPPTERRVKERTYIAETLARKDVPILDRLDAVIDFFRAKYEKAEHGGLSWAERKLLFEERGGQCMWCVLPLKRHEFTVEHIVPLAEGGTWEWENLGIAHEACNNGRDHEKYHKNGYLKSAMAERVPDAIIEYK